MKYILDLPNKYLSLDMSIIKSINKAGNDCKIRPSSKGYWINYKDEHRCSNCNEVVTGDWDDEYWYDFCPFCGAEMENEHEISN